MACLLGSAGVKGRRWVGPVLVLLALLALVVAPSLATPTAQAAAGCSSDNAVDDRIPLLFVHGFISNARAWDAAVKRFCNGEVYATTFDYSAVHANWVTDPKIGRHLAERIVDLAEMSVAGGGPGKVLLVGHSMGGLAIRCAADGRCNGGGALGAPAGQASPVADAIGAVVTFDTPNEGTFLRQGGRYVIDGFLGPLLSARCYVSDHISDDRWWNPVVDFWCDWERKFATSAAARAFTPGSRELATLPGQPGGVPVLSVAGHAGLEVPLFWHRLRVPGTTVGIGDLGDYVVSAQSAHAQQRAVNGFGGVKDIDCGHMEIGVQTAGPVRVAHISAAKLDCWHMGEPSEEKWLDQVAAMVDWYWWRNQEIPTGWESGATVTLRDGKAAACSEEYCAYSVPSITVQPASASRPSTATVVLWGHDGDGWPLGQTLMVLEARPDGIVLVRASDSGVYLPEDRALCDTTAVSRANGDVEQMFSNCFDASGAGSEVWHLSGALLALD